MKRLVFVCLMGSLVASAGCGSSSPSKTPVVAMDTSMGTIKVELYPDKAPITVKNFLTYVEDKYYDGTIFHRVMGLPHSDKDFMIQGGGFVAGKMDKEKPTAGSIKNESDNGLRNERGTIAMARTGDPDSATAQFYINVADNRFLDRDQSRDGFGYCVFGRVIEGMDVADQIKSVPTTTKGQHSDVPVQDVVIKSIRRVD